MSDHTIEDEQKQNSLRLNDATIDSELGIETITFKCTKDLAKSLHAQAALLGMELAPFVRRLLTEHPHNLSQASHSSREATFKRPFDWGDCRRTEPLHRDFGFAAGQPIDRYYIDRFMATNQSDIHGHVLEVADSRYTRRFGGDRVTKADILHVQAGQGVTIVGDLVSGEGIPTSAFDCIILTQTLPFVFDVRKAIATCRRALKTEGVLLCTVNGISQISRYDMDRWGDYWRFTDLSLTKLLKENFSQEAMAVVTYGNVLSAIAFLLGVPAQDLPSTELDPTDPDYQVLIGAKARKTATVQ